MRKIVYLLRIAAQSASLLLIALVILLYSFGFDALSFRIVENWPYSVSVIVLYALLTISEDYLNARVLAPRL